MNAVVALLALMFRPVRVALAIAVLAIVLVLAALGMAASAQVPAPTTTTMPGNPCPVLGGGNCRSCPGADPSLCPTPAEPANSTSSPAARFAG